MKRLTLATALTPVILLLCGSLARIQAADTKIVVKDGGSPPASSGRSRYGPNVDAQPC